MTPSLVHLINCTIVKTRRLQVLILRYTSQMGDFGLFILSQSNSLYWDAVMGKIDRKSMMYIALSCTK